jgi:60 kDa SS-A/Ro ribonucleoprotein
MAFLKHRVVPPIPQSRPLDAKQRKNAAGGYTYSVDDWARLVERFLTIGTVGGTFYASEQKITDENLAVVQALLDVDGPRVVAKVLEVSDGGRALRQDYGLVALALAASMAPHTPNGDATRQAAYKAIPRVCRTASTLFQFLSYIKGRRGWSRGLRSAIAGWYNDMPVGKLAYQMVKYRNRNDFAHRDALLLAHVKASHHSTHDLLYRWAVGKAEADGLDALGLPKIVGDYEAVRTAPPELSSADDFRAAFSRALPREALPTDWLNDPKVWEALLYGEGEGGGMPVTALIRNLGNLSKCGLLTAGSAAERFVVGELLNESRLRAGRVHPLALFVANKVYGQGHGQRGSGTWAPVGTVQDALLTAFELAMPNVEPSGKKLLVAIDSSGSMAGAQVLGIPGTSAIEVCAAMALIHLRTEKDPTMTVFDTSIKEFKVSPDTSLERLIARLPHMGGGTDCSLPFQAAQAVGGIEGVLVLTDGETWWGTQVTQVMDAWRKQVPQGRAAFAATCANSVSLPRADDRLSLNVAGFDSAAPSVIAGFLGGRL